jgi:MoaA/NifB/PqqE/SkfB family radical SAM enzyme
MADGPRFSDSFLDHIPDPPMGRVAYRQALERSFLRDEAEVSPLYALLKVTNRCASQCRYCGHAGVADQTGEATTGQLVDVLDQLADIGAVSVNLTGGEPLQRCDLPHLARHARERGLFSILLTNGALLRQRSAELRHAGLGMVIVSIDSIRPEAYRATRGMPLAPVLDGVDALLDWPARERPVVTATVVVTSENLDHLNEVVAYFGRRGVGVKLCPYHHYGSRRSDHLSPKDPVAYRAAIAQLVAMKTADLGVINSFAYLDNFTQFNFRRRTLPPEYRCYCGYTTLYIDHLLNVRSCWSQGLAIAGNLHKHRLRDLLTRPGMRRMRRQIRQLDCERCWLLCTAEISLRFQG